MLNAEPSGALTSSSAAGVCRALVMAGGRSERMRVTSGVHKALMLVGGQSLIERNLQTLFAEGFYDVVVAVHADEPEIEAFIETRGSELAALAGATLSCLRESVSLGTIGAAAIAADEASDLLVVNVDNLTTLPLRLFLEHHRSKGAAFTIASHREHFPIPFGQLIIGNGAVLEYREKPRIPVAISSGTYVLGPEAVALIEPHRRFDVTHLFQAAKDHALVVAAFEHDCLWIDVNDEASLHRAEEVFGRAHPAEDTRP